MLGIQNKELLSYWKILKRSMVPQLLFVITIFTSGIIVNLVQLILYLCLRPLNKYLYRKINWYLFYTIHAQLAWLADWWSGLNLVLYMDKNDFDKYLGKRHCVCIMNHTYELDWLIALIFSERLRILGNTKAFIKKSLQYVPVLGFSWKLSDCIMLERSFEKDKEVIRKQVEELATYSDPIMLLLFPEGTRFTPAKHKASEEFARLNNLQPLKHHLQPRTRGFITSIPPMRGKISDIYDTILAFDEEGPVKPTMMSVMLGESVTAHVYVKRIPMEDLPDSEDGLKKLCEDMYVRKDKLKESFGKTGDFFATSGVPRTEQITLNRRYYPLINMVFWAIVILCPMVYYIAKLLLSGSPLYFGIGIGIIGLFMGFLFLMLRVTEKSTGSSYGTKNGKSH